VLPYAVVRDEVARGTLAFLPIEHDPLQTVHAIASRAGPAPAPFVLEVRRVLSGVMSGLANSGAWAGASVVWSSARAGETATRPILEAAIE
jgi:hypothetical protein